MKAVILLLLATSCIVEAAARKPVPEVAKPPLPAPAETPRFTVNADGSVTRSQQADAELRDWITGMVTENGLNKQRALDAEKSETNVRVELGVANNRADSFQEKVNALTKDRNDQAAAKDKALTQADYWHQKHSEAVAKLWWWRLWAGAAIGVGVLLIALGLVMRFTKWGSQTLAPLIKPI